MDRACSKSQGMHGMYLHCLWRQAKRSARNRSALLLVCSSKRNQCRQKPFWGHLVCDGTGSAAELCPQGSHAWGRWLFGKIYKLLLVCAWHNLDEISQESVFPWTTWWRVAVCQVCSGGMAACSFLTTHPFPSEFGQCFTNVWPFHASKMNCSP